MRLFPKKIIKNKDLCRKCREIQQMNNQTLNRANLIRTLSHDLRTPLTSILGNSDLYLHNYDKLSDKERKDMVSLIRTKATLLSNMIDNILTLTRISSNDFTLSTSSEQVEEVVSEAIMTIQYRYPTQKIIGKVPIEMLFLPMDAILIEKVLINLFENSILHSGSIDPIELIVTEESDQVEFSVRDYGKGIDNDKITHILDPVSFLNTSSENPSDSSAKGMGLGLSICQAIVQAHNGAIYCENLSKGARFYFRLPKEVL